MKSNPTESDPFVINGFRLPSGLVRRIQTGTWVAPVDKTKLRRLIEAQSPWPAGVEWLDQLVEDFTLYLPALMKSESEGLYRWLEPKRNGDRVLFLGDRDERIHPGFIEPGWVILIADFGLGSDTALALDYREDQAEPSVILQYWGENPTTDNRWKKIADSFTEWERAIW